jgi:DNA-binding transcriptional LysR family regulator
MLIDKINLNLLRIFEVVYKTKSMTKASKELHMTQSGVSQNIKHLEELLGVILFDRVKQRPVPTHKAKVLYKVASQNLLEIEKALIEITEQ